MSDDTKANGSVERECWAWVSEEKGKPLVRKNIKLPPLGPNQVEVRIEYSGICKSDVDALAGHYPTQVYPFPIVAGHEGVGIITAVGSNVKTRKVGDKVGCGVYRGSCMSCVCCSGGNSNLCGAKQMMFALGQTGTFSQYVRLDAPYAIPVPDAIELQHAGPLMCAGATVFAPFKTHDIQPGDKVGVVGIGGLGHLALQFANAYGCEVYAISRGTKKADESKEMGAHTYVDSTDADAMKALTGKLHYILVTAGGRVDYNQLLGCLRNGGAVIVIGFPGFEDIPISPMALVLGQKTVCGSASSSLSNYLEMVNFAALHGIKPKIEKYNFEEINEAIERVSHGPRYRVVVCHDKTK